MTKPDVITIHLGTNDCSTPPASAVAALRALLETIGLVRAFHLSAPFFVQWGKNRLCVLDRHYAGTA